MNKRYTFKPTKIINIAIYTLLIALVASTITNIVLLTLEATSPDVDSTLSITSYIIGLVFSVIAFIPTLMLKVGLFYSLTDSGFRLNFVLPKIKIKYDDILFFRESESENLTLMYYKMYEKDGGEMMTYLSLCIDPKHNKDFFNTVKSYNNNVVYESFDKLKFEMENTDDEYKR